MQDLLKIKSHDQKVFLIAAAIYTFYFLIVFMQFPLHHCLPGRADTILHLSLFNDYWNRISSVMTHSPIGNGFYPEYSVQKFSELYLGEAGIFIFFKSIFRDNILSYYFFISALYIFNAIGAFLFSRFILKNSVGAFVVGFIFSSSSFIFDQIDLLNGIPYFFFFLSLFYIAKYILQEPRLKYLLYAAVCAALQFYFSNYIFLYLCLTGIALIVCYKSSVLIENFFYKHLFAASICVAVMLFPYLYLTDFESHILHAYNPINIDIINRFSLTFSDLVRYLPNSRLYSYDIAGSTEVVKTTNDFFLGFFTYAIALITIAYVGFRKLMFPVILIVIGIVIALGPFIDFNGHLYKAPLYYFYQHLGLERFLRIPSRGFSVFVLGVALIIGYLIAQTEGLKSYAFASCFLGIFFLENVPKKFDAFIPSYYVSPPQSISRYFEEQPDKNKITIAFLPSSLFSKNRFNRFGVSEYSREYTYMSWQTFLKVNVINGSSSFFPYSRLYNNNKMEAVDQRDSVIQLIKANDMDYIVLSKDKYFMIDSNDKNISAYLSKYGFLKKVISTSDAELYMVKKDSLMAD